MLMLLFAARGDGSLSSNWRGCSWRP